MLFTHELFGKHWEPFGFGYIYIYTCPTLCIGFGKAEYKYLALTKGIIIWQVTVSGCGRSHNIPCNSPVN